MLDRKKAVEGMIDLHTHLLPDWDDGPDTWEETEKMLEIAVADGVGAVCLTPHLFRFSRYQDSQKILEERFSQFFEKFGSDSRIHFFRGAEVFIHPDLVNLLGEKNLRLNSSEYFFVEFPSDQLPSGTRDLFYQLMLAGYTPIISHPERNTIFGNHPELLYDLVNRGCLAQVTAGSLTGEFGSEIQKRADLFLKNHLVHLIASDAHNPEKRKPILSRGVEAAARIAGWELAEAMVRDVPAAILSNSLVPDLGSPLNPGVKKKFFGFLRK